MGRRKAAVAESAEEELLDQLEDECKPTQEELDEVQMAPTMGSPEWNSYVMAQFTPDEVDDKGNPFIHGLRRVTRSLIGPVLESESTTIVPPAFQNGKMCPVTVEHRLVLLWARDLPEDCAAQRTSFKDVADVHIENTAPEFLKYPTATASTRAEARCYRKALQLKTVAAEEIDAPALPNHEFITNSQKVFLDNLCKRFNVNALAFINGGKTKFDDVSRIPYEKAQEIAKTLGKMSTKDEVPEQFRGYEKGWF